MHKGTAINILGIPLKTPNASGLAVVTLLTLLASALGAILMVAGMFTIMDFLPLVTGVLGGSLATAYGVSVRDHGWRAVVVVVVFTLAMTGMAMGVAWLVA